MNLRTRTENAKKNILVGLASQIIILALSFVGRKLFVRFLSIDYLGINGLYSNILSVLSLAELGLGSVVTFSLYKPVFENNQPIIRALIKYYRKVYIVIALIVSGIGVALIPYLRYIVKSNLAETELIFYYVLFLIDAVMTYYIAHKVALLAANQENRIQRYVDILSAFIQQICHIVILLLFPNYILYVASTVFVTLISKVIMNIVINDKYSYIRQPDTHDIEINKKSITKNIKSTAVYKLSTVLINSTDNILISIIVNTAAIGLYSNYYMIVNALRGFITIITSAISNGVGNLYAQKSNDRILEVFNTLVLLYHFVSCFCAISMFFIFNDFITIWIGEAYLFDKQIVFAISFNFYLTNLLTPIWSFRESTGQFVKAKYIMLITALLNIVLSIVLGIPLGVFGILIATALSKILTQVWYEPRILFKNVFHEPPKIYWASQLKNVICTVICVIVSMMISNAFSSSIFSIFVKGILFFVVCFSVFFVAHFKDDEINTINGFISMISRTKAKDIVRYF